MLFQTCTKLTFGLSDVFVVTVIARNRINGVGSLLSTHAPLLEPSKRSELRFFSAKMSWRGFFHRNNKRFSPGGWGVGWGLSSEEAMTRRTKTTTGARNHVKGCSTSVTKFTSVTKKRFSLGEIYDECGTRNFPENCNLICFDLALFTRNENKQVKF